MTTNKNGDNGIIKAKYVKRYGRAGNCGDRIAKLLREYLKDGNGKMNHRKLANVANANDIVMAPWKELSGGLRRMALGNCLRGRHRDGKTVVIGKTRIKGAAPTAH